MDKLWIKHETRKYCFMFSKRYLTSSNLGNFEFKYLFHYFITIQLLFSSFIPNIFLQSKIEQIKNWSNFLIGCSRLHYAKLHIISINHQIETILSQTTSTRITQLKRSQTSLIRARLYVLSTRERERNQTCW